MKTCKTCKVEKVAEDFTAARATCKTCRAIANAGWYARNREKTLQNVAHWQANNRDKVKAYKQKWFDENPGARAALIRKRQARQLKATPQWADITKIRELYFAADFLGMVTGEWHHVDHIVPLQSKTVCGLHVEQNLQVLPASDNLRKSNRQWPDMP